MTDRDTSVEPNTKNLPLISRTAWIVCPILSFLGAISNASSKYPPAKPEALWLAAPQRGLCQSAPRRHQPPAPRRRRNGDQPRASAWGGRIQKFIRSPVRDGAYAPRPCKLFAKRME